MLSIARCTDFVAQNSTVSVSIESLNISSLVLPSIHGWIIWTQRLDASLNFNVPWANYRDGFGSINASESFWLGLNAVNKLTTGGPGGQGSWKLRVEFQSKQTGSW